MKRVFQEKDFKKIIDEIVKHNYDANYASVIASDYLFEENPDVEFTEDFSKRYHLVMDYFITSRTENDPIKFKRIVDDLNIAANSGKISKEEQVYILSKEEIKKYKQLYRRNKISFNVLETQISRLGNYNEFDVNLFIDKFIRDRSDFQDL